MADPSLAAVAADLYAGSLGEFVAERNARAKAVEDAELGAQIRALRKPSIAAWVVNLFARERSEQLGQALQLAVDLREAQADLDRAALAKLGRERRALTRRLAEEASALATARGERVTDSTLEAVQQTIAAAFFDPDAAAAVSSGRLLRELEPSAEFHLDEMVAGGRPDKKPVAPRPIDEVKKRREHRDAERATETAEQNLERARRDQEKANQNEKDAEERIEQRVSHVSELEADLARARKEEKNAREALEDAIDQQSAAADRVASAEHELVDARAALNGL